VNQFNEVVTLLTVRNARGFIAGETSVLKQTNKNNFLGPKIATFEFWLRV